MSSRLIPPTRRLEQLAEPDDVVGVFGADLEIEDVEVGELLEEVAFALHHRLSGERSDVAEPEHGSAVGDDGDEVSAGSVLVGVVGILLDLEAGLGDAGRVGEGEIALVVERLCGNDSDFARPPRGVVIESVFSLHFDWRLTT